MPDIPCPCTNTSQEAGSCFQNNFTISLIHFIIALICKLKVFLKLRLQKEAHSLPYNFRLVSASFIKKYFPPNDGFLTILTFFFISTSVKTRKKEIL